MARSDRMAFDSTIRDSMKLLKKKNFDSKKYMFVEETSEINHFSPPRHTQGISTM